MAFHTTPLVPKIWFEGGWKTLAELKAVHFPSPLFISSLSLLLSLFTGRWAWTQGWFMNEEGRWAGWASSASNLYQKHPVPISTKCHIFLFLKTSRLIFCCQRSTKYILKFTWKCIWSMVWTIIYWLSNLPRQSERKNMYDSPVACLVMNKSTAILLFIWISYKSSLFVLLHHKFVVFFGVFTSHYSGNALD